MQRLIFTKIINASSQKVYETMLGLNSKNTYEQWTSAFSPTSSFEGSWEKGSKILFVSITENGKKGGMVSKILENEPARFVSILHYGFLDGDKEVTTGEEVEKWAGGHENYIFQEENSITTLTVEVDSHEDYMDYFNKIYPLALEKLKVILE